MRVSTITLQNLAIGYVCLWILSPPLAYGTLYRLAAFAAMAGWLLVETMRTQGIIRRPTLPVLLTGIYIVYTVVFEYLTGGTRGLIANSQFYIMLFFVLVYQSRRNDPQSMTGLFWLVIGLMALWMTTTYTALTGDNARAMRNLVRSSDETRELIEQGVGGYWMAYGAVLMLPCLLGLILSRHRFVYDRLPKVLRWFPFVARPLIYYVAGLSTLIILFSQFSTAVFLMTLGILSVVVFWRFNLVRSVFLVVAALVFLFFWRDFLHMLLELLRPLALGTNYVIKVDALLESLRLNEATGAASDRIERYWRSILLFAENPLIGVLSYADVGKHSTFLDAFARWGAILGTILVYVMTFHTLRDVRRRQGAFGVAIGTLIATFGVLGLNKHFSAVGIILFIVYPVVMSYLREASEPEADVMPEVRHA